MIIKILLKNKIKSSYYKVITKCDENLLQSASGITKCDRLLLQSASGITKSDSYHKVRRNTGHFQHANTDHIMTMSFIRIKFSDDFF